MIMTIKTDGRYLKTVAPVLLFDSPNNNLAIIQYFCKKKSVLLQLEKE